MAIEIGRWCVVGRGERRRADYILLAGKWNPEDLSLGSGGQKKGLDTSSVVIDPICCCCCCCWIISISWRIGRIIDPSIIPVASLLLPLLPLLLLPLLGVGV